MMEKIVAVAADFWIILPSIILFQRRAYLQSPLNKIIAIYVLLFLIRNILSYITMELNIYNMYIYNWANIFSGITISMLYYHLFTNKYFKIIALVGMIAAVGASFLDYETLFNVNTTNFNRFFYNILGGLVIACILFYFYELLQNLNVPKLTEFTPFWFSTGALLYYSGTVFSYLYVNYTFNNSDLGIVRSYWMIDAFLFIVFSSFLSMAVWYMKPRDLKSDF